MRRVVAHVFVDDLARPVVAGQDFHHLSRVLRLRPGEAVSAADGRGGWRPCRWAGVAALEPAGDMVTEPRPTPLLTVAFALTKGDRPEWTVQKLTELGADRIVVMTTEHCVVRWGPAQEARQLGRLQEVARLAAMQSRRSWLPAVEGPLAFCRLTGPPGGGTGQGGGEGEGGGEGMALAVPGGPPISLGHPTVLIGPEGGWSDEELATVPHHVGLGPHVLRSETAALAAGALLAALRDGLVKAAEQAFGA